MASPVILDTGHSIDDLFAIALAACSPELHLVGVVTAGDDDAARARLIRLLLDAYGRTDVPVANGSGTNPRADFYRRYLEQAARADALPPVPEQQAADFLYSRLLRYGRVALAVVGPLTNVAELLHRYPDARERIGHIYFAGGWITQALPEHNLRLDPEAAARVLETDIPFTALGYEATRGYRLLRPHRMQLETSSAPGPRILSAIFRAWGGEFSDPAPGVLDPMLITYLCGMAPAEFETVPVAVETEGPGRGALYRKEDGGREIQVATKMDGSLYIDFLTSRVAPRGPEEAEINPSRWTVDLRAAYELEHYPGWSLTKSRHVWHMLALVVAGRCEVAMPSGRHELEAGAALYMAPGDEVTVTSKGGMRAFWFYFDVATRTDDRLLTPLSRLPWPRVFEPVADIDRWPALARRVERHWLHPWPEATLLCQGAFLELVAHLCTRAEEQQSPAAGQPPAAVLQAKRWIEARVNESITLDELASSVAVSKYHLLRTFREAFGVPPLQYHRQLRLEHARRLLRLPHLSVREVAARVGYESTTAFTRAFKREYGVAPSDVQAGAMPE